MNFRLQKKSVFFIILILSFAFTACNKLKESNSIALQPTLNSSATRFIAAAGIGSGSTFFDLKDTRDLIVPFDFYSSGKNKQLIVYRPGTGIIWMYNNVAPSGSTPNFSRIFASGSGLGSAPNNYDLRDNRDRIIPYDLDGTGGQNYVICFRPGARVFYIFKNVNGVFTAVYKSTTGVGAFDLSDSRDKIVPFDFYNTGHATELICYRPGTGVFWVMKNQAPPGSAPNFIPVHTSSDGIGQDGNKWNLADNRDLIIPWTKDPKLLSPTLICYRPGTESICTVIRENAPLDPTKPFKLINSSWGVWGDQFNWFDLATGSDRLIPYDYDYFGNGITSTLVCYRPTSGKCQMFWNYPFYDENPDIGLVGLNIYNEGSRGIGSGSTFFDLSNANDKVFAYDLDGTGKIDHLVCYRPGSGAFWIFNNSLVKIY